MWHYHATLGCDHRIAFDSPHNYYLTNKAMGESNADVAIYATCPTCGKASNSKNLAVNSGTRPECKVCMAEPARNPRREVHHGNHDR